MKWKKITEDKPIPGQKVILRKSHNDVSIARLIFWEALGTDEWLINGMTYLAVEPSDEWLPIPD